MSLQHTLFIAAATFAMVIPIAAFGGDTTFCQNSPPVPIPDNNPAGVSSFIDFSDDIVIEDVQVLVQVSHTFIGDLDLDVTSPGGTTVQLHNEGGGSANDMNVTFSDAGIPNGPPYTCACIMMPSGPGVMSDFLDESSLGSWEIHIVDNAGGDTGTLDNSCVTVAGLGVTLPVSGLLCISEPGSGIADLSWNNGAVYDAVNIYVNGGFEASLPGSATTYSTAPVPVPQTAEICVEGVIAGVPSILVCCMVFLEEPVGAPVQFCSDTTPIAIPDNNPAGISDTLFFGDSFGINDTAVLVQVTHTFVGDLDIDVTSPGGTTVQLHNEGGGSSNDMNVTYRDSGVPNGAAPYTCGCVMQPSGPGALSDFDGEDPQGTWTLFIEDVAGGDVGTLDNWCVTAYGFVDNDFIRGDCDGDGVWIALIDSLYCLDFGFLGGPPPPCLEAADVNGDGTLDLLVDSLHNLNHGFSAGPPPAPPYPLCGPDPDPGGSFGCDATACP